MNECELIEDPDPLWARCMLAAFPKIMRRVREGTAIESDYRRLDEIRRTLRMTDAEIERQLSEPCP